MAIANMSQEELLEYIGAAADKLEHYTQMSADEWTLNASTITYHSFRAAVELYKMRQVPIDQYEKGYSDGYADGIHDAP